MDALDVHVMEVRLFVLSTRYVLLAVRWVVAPPAQANAELCFWRSLVVLAKIKGATAALARAGMRFMMRYPKTRPRRKSAWRR